ncbi:hypothetical protein E2C01_024120 [Portunus trituberculatus]|uniref:Uncharacterized protein n=1 Tax=Portunus trituberculatus TaxID=210409 RepID=A0A5B7E9Q9_PORTR|nr:hypothetical protein [Portunus trituberculatus]
MHGRTRQSPFNGRESWHHLVQKVPLNYARQPPPLPLPSINVSRQQEGACVAQPNRVDTTQSLRPAQLNVHPVIILR